MQETQCLIPGPADPTGHTATKPCATPIGPVLQPLGIKMTEAHGPLEPVLHNKRAAPTHRS